MKTNTHRTPVAALSCQMHGRAVMLAAIVIALAGCASKPPRSEVAIALDKAVESKNPLRIAEASEAYANYRYGRPTESSHIRMRANAEGGEKFWAQAGRNYARAGQNSRAESVLTRCVDTVSSIGYGEKCDSELLRIVTGIGDPQKIAVLKAAQEQRRLLRNGPLAKESKAGSDREMVEVNRELAEYEAEEERQKREDAQAARQIVLGSLAQTIANSSAKATSPSRSNVPTVTTRVQPSSNAHADSRFSSAPTSTAATSTGSTPLRPSSQRINVPGHKACIDVQFTKTMFKGVFDAKFRNSCAMQLVAHFCQGAGCTRAKSSTDMIRSGGTVTASLSADDGSTVRVLQACAVKSAAEAWSTYDSATNQCVGTVEMR